MARTRTLLTIAGILSLAGAAHAQAPVTLSHVEVHRQMQDAPACTAVAPPPPELARWDQRQPLVAGTRLGSDQTPELMIGQAADVALRPAGKVFFSPPVGKAIQPGEQGGLVAFRIGLTGTYRVALGDAAWVDVVRGGQPLASVTHQRGPACSGIRKMVDFQLSPGRYLLQLSGTGAASVAVMIAQLP